MRKLWAVVKREYLERVRSRWFVFATVFGPVLFAGLMFLPAYFASKSKESADVARIRVLDASGTDVGKRVAAELSGGPMSDGSRAQVVAMSQTELAAAESTATRDVRTGQIKGYLVFDGSTFLPSKIRYAGTNATALADVRRIENVVRGEVFSERLIAAGVAPSNIGSLKKFDFNLRAERITSTGRGGSGRLNILFALIVAMLLYATILIYGQNVLRSVLEEKQTRVAEVVVASVPATTLLAGKVLGVGAVGLTQIVAWMASSIILAKVRTAVLAKLGVAATPFALPGITPPMLLLLIVFFVLGYTLYSAMFAAVGAMVSSEQEAQQAQMPIVLVLVMSVVLMQSALTEPDGRLAQNLSWIPFSAPIVMPLRLATVSVSGWDVFTSIALLVSTCYVAVFAAARIYRTGILMYGKKPNLRELARWVAASRR
jgi:ABC-2 type transport system permease protein